MTPTGQILVVAEILPAQRGGRLLNLSLEALAAAQHLAATLSLDCSGVVLNHGDALAAAAAELAGNRLARIYSLDHPLLQLYTPDAYTLALQQLIERVAPAVVLFPHTYQVRDFAPALATRFHQVLLSDVIAIRTGAAGEPPTFVRQLMQGKLNGDYKHAPQASATDPAPCFVSLQAGAFRADSLQPAPQPAPIEPVLIDLDASQIRTIPGEPFREAAHTVDLAASPIIVSVGRGIREAENIPIVQALADALHADLAASRPICDAGWLPMERQVGSSGQTVSPKLYLAVGISGAIQHLVGMKGSHTVIAINKDPEAPIFEVCDYGIAGDLFEVVPALTKAILAAKS
jgi:electron transfer flavoprotein alpha subunit